MTSAAAAEGDAELFSNRMRLSALIHLESMDLTCGAACALLAHLSRFASRDELPGKEASLGIVQIEMLKLDKILQVSAATQRALSIFNEETVANPSSSGQKEGLSLFSLLNWTCAGGSRIRQPTSMSSMRDTMLSNACFALRMLAMSPCLRTN